jgi:hypothetical protein
LPERPDNVVKIGLHRPSGDLLFIDLDGVLDRLFHAVEIQRLVAGDALGHLPDEAFRDVALPRRLLGIVFHQQIEDRAIGDMLREIIGILELAAGVAVNRLEPRKMRRLRSARAIGRRVPRTARRVRRRLGDHQQLLVIEREPSLPLGIGNGRALPERAAERRQAPWEIGIFGDQRLLLAASAAAPHISPTRCTTASQ